MHTLTNPPSQSTIKQPTTRAEAKAAGLRVWQWGLYCRFKGHGNDKFVRSGECVACHAAKEAKVMKMIDAERGTIVERARAQLLREQVREAKRQAEEAVRQARCAERERLKAQREKERKRALLEARNAAKESPPAIQTPEPYEAPADAFETAPWD